MVRTFGASFVTFKVTANGANASVRRGAPASLEDAWLAPGTRDGVETRSARRYIRRQYSDREHESPAASELEMAGVRRDRKSTRLNSSHSQISYAVFCL